jgi:MFS family permease
MLINFADKTVVGLAAVPIMRDLELTPRQFGFLGSSFSFLFAVSGILVGFVANRIATRWVLLALAFFLGGRAVSDGWGSRVHDLGGLPRASWRRRRAGFLSCGACALQMVP